MRHRKLSTKLFGGFVFLLFLTTTMAYLGWHNLKVLNANVDRRVILNQIIKNTLEVRRQEKNYIIRGGQEYLDRVSRSIQNVKDLAAQCRRLMPEPTSQASLDRILESLGLYEAAFNRYVGLSRQLDVKKSPDQKGLLDQANNDMVSAARALQKEAETSLSNQKASMQAGLATASTLIVCSAVLAILVGLLVSLLLVKSLTRTLNRIISNLGDGSEQVAAASLQVASASNSLAAGSSQQAASLEETTASLEELASLV